MALGSLISIILPILMRFYTAETYFYSDTQKYVEWIKFLPNFLLQTFHYIFFNATAVVMFRKMYMKQAFMCLMDPNLAKKFGLDEIYPKVNLMNPHTINNMRILYKSIE